MQIFKRRGSKELSTSKIWFHIVNVIVSYIYLKVGLAVASSANPNLEGLALLTFAYVGLITGNKIASAVLKERYANTNAISGHQVQDLPSNRDRSDPRDYRDRSMDL